MWSETSYPNRLADVVMRYHRGTFGAHSGMSFGGFINHIDQFDAPPPPPPPEDDPNVPPPGVPAGATKFGDNWIVPIPGTDKLAVYDAEGIPTGDTFNKSDVDGSGGSGAAPAFAGTGEGIRQFDLELAEDIRHNKAVIKQLEKAQEAETGRNRERIVADLTIARERLAMDLRIQKMDLNTRLKIARKEAELGLRGQDIERQGNVLAAKQGLLEFAATADPFTGAAALIGDPSGTTPFDVAATDFRDTIARIDTSVRDVDPLSGLDFLAAEGLPRSSTFNIMVGEKGGNDGDEEVVRVDRATGKLIDIIPIDRLGFGKQRVDVEAADGLTLHDINSELAAPPALAPPTALTLPTEFAQPTFTETPTASIAPGAPVPTTPPGEPSPNPDPGPPRPEPAPTARTLAQVNADPRRLQYSKFGIDPFALDASAQLDAAKQAAGEKATSEAAETKATDESFVVRANDGSREVFLVKNGRRQHVPDPRTLFSLGFTFNDVKTISVASMAAIPEDRFVDHLKPRLIGSEGSQGIYIELNGQKSLIANTDELRKLVAAGIVPNLKVQKLSDEEFEAIPGTLQPFLTENQKGQQTAERTLRSLLGEDAVASGLQGNDFNLNPVFNTALPNPSQLANLPFLFSGVTDEDPQARTLLSAFSRPGNDLPFNVVRDLARRFRPSTIGSGAPVSFG